jgi:phosphoribosylformimino-5-aminoimidazole carboxamide ribotide isomerase
MIIFPAIDIKDGKCVRLLQGDLAKETVFHNHPAEQAKDFEALGFQWIHIVDLNGAVEGKAVNGAVVKAIIQSVTIPVQLGGGIRSMQAIESWLEAGVSRIVLGTAALKNPQLVKEACRRYPDQIVVGIDARGKKVAIEGWVHVSNDDPLTLAKRFEDAGVAAIIYTDIERDGIMAGPDLQGTLNLAEAVSIPIIASGGVRSVSDITELKTLESSGLVGLICGRALYEGAIDPKAALLAASAC